VLTEHQSDHIERLVKSGQYQNASEVLRAGLRLVETEESEAKARIGIADIEAGRYRAVNSAAEMANYLVEQVDKTITGTRVAKKGG
jgi:antitoxin ParD1/3/4